VDRIFDDVLMIKKKQIAFGAVKDVFTQAAITLSYGA